MALGEPKKTDKKQNILNMTLAVVAGQVGCLTLVIVLAAVLGGLWLDSRFQTRPIFTLVLLLVSIPISILIMLWVSRAAVRKIKAQSETTKPVVQEDINIGEEK